MSHRSTRRRAAALTALAFTALLGTSAVASADTFATGRTAPAVHSATYGPSKAKMAKKHAHKVMTAGTSVKIDNFKFGPRTLTVKVGTKVTWTNDDSIAHSVNFSSVKVDSKTLDRHGKFSHTFTTPGTYKYICAIHPFMHGAIVVTA
jgi:amicyanin